MGRLEPPPNLVHSVSVPFPLFIALKHIRKRALQSALTVLGVAVGVMVLVTALSLTNGFISELIRSTLRATPHVTLQDYTGETFEEDEALLERLQAHENVVAAAPYISTEVLIARRADATRGIGARQGFTQILGIDPELEQAVLADLDVIAEQADALAQERGIVLGASLYRTLGVFEGDPVSILNAAGRRRELVVADRFRVGNELLDNLISFTSIPTLQDFLRAEGEISGYHIRLDDPNLAPDVGLALAQQTGLLAQSWQASFSTLIEQLQLQKALIGVVVFLIILVASIGIANVLILTVIEKTEDIAILRAMGASRQQILTVFTLEGALLGGTGTLLGALLGFGISLYFKLKPFPLPGDLYFITALPVQIQAFDFIWVCALSLATSIIAGVAPARRAVGLNPVEILR